MNILQLRDKLNDLLAAGHGSSYDNHSKACDTHTSPSYDSGSSDSGGSCSPSSD